MVTKLVSLVAGLFFPLLANAGGWSSSGGDNIKDGHNPWFLQNVASISYCIQIDTTTISASRERLTELTARSIKDWQRIFSNYRSLHPSDLVQVGTQNWEKKESCDESVDVKFKFGWGALSKEEMQYFAKDGRSGDKIAEAVRTDYSKTSLRGKGFIYIASDLGANAMRLTKDQLETPWRFPTLVYLELMHELGHVFGLPHLASSLGQFSQRWIMSEYFPEMILQKVFWADRLPSREDPGEGITYFFDTSEFESCSISEIAKKWFPTSHEIACVNVRFFGGAAAPEAIEFSFKDDHQKVIFQAKLNALFSQSHTVGDISVYLPPEQVVFQSKPGNFPNLSGPGATTGEYSGELKLPSGIKKKIMLIKTEDFLKIVGFDQNLKMIRTVITAGPK